MSKGKFKIAVDFDGTCVAHRYPYIGNDAELCVETLKEWVEKYDVGIILSTMRCDKELDVAVNWFKSRDIPLYGVQKDPTQETWTSSPKCNANICIDDRNIGCPLKLDSEKKMWVVDWKKVKKLVDPIIKKYYEN